MVEKDTVISCMLCLMFGVFIGYIIHPDISSTSSEDRIERVEKMIEISDYQAYNVYGKIFDNNTTIGQLKHIYFNNKNRVGYYNSEVMASMVLKHICEGTIRNPLE